MNHTNITHPYDHLRNHQSAIYVYPTHREAHHAMREFAEVPAPDMPDIEMLFHRHALLRTNPSSRIPTTVLFTGCDTSAEAHQAFKAIIEIPDRYRLPRRLFSRWVEAQTRHERFRK